MPNRYAVIAGIGSCLPERRLTNADLEEMVDTTDEWIVTRTGIRERRVVDEGQASSDLGAVAVRQALDRAGVKPDEVDLLVAASSSPDMLWPATACLIQAKLGMTCPAYDVQAACTGFVYALESATATIESGRADTVVVVGAEAVTRLIDFTDRATCVLFGDAAGAIVLKASDEPGVESIVLGADGSGADQLCVPSSGSAMPPTHETVESRATCLHMNGNEIYKFAVRAIPKATQDALEGSGHSIADLKWLIPHQANQRILDTIEERLGVDHGRVFSNVEWTGNTSSASIPLALDELYTSGRLTPGDLIALVGFGAGLTWGAAVVRWSLPVPTNREA